MRRLYAGSLDSAEATYLGDFPSTAFYVEPGFLFFVDDGTLKAVAFDAESLRVEGEPRVIEDGIAFFRPLGRATCSVSRNGTVVFQRPRAANRHPSSSVRRIAWNTLDAASSSRGSYSRSRASG